MYLHLGNGVVVPDGKILGVFDLDNTTSDSRDTRSFLRRAEQAGRVVSVSDELPKSFVVCDEAVYLSQLAPATLLRRSETGAFE